MLQALEKIYGEIYEELCAQLPDVPMPSYESFRSGFSFNRERGLLQNSCLLAYSIDANGLSLHNKKWTLAIEEKYVNIHLADSGIQDILTELQDFYIAFLSPPPIRKKMQRHVFLPHNWTENPDFSGDYVTYILKVQDSLTTTFGLSFLTDINFIEQSHIKISINDLNFAFYLPKNDANLACFSPRIRFFAALARGWDFSSNPSFSVKNPLYRTFYIEEKISAAACFASNSITPASELQDMHLFVLELAVLLGDLKVSLSLAPLADYLIHLTTLIWKSLFFPENPADHDAALLIGKILFRIFNPFRI